uniref:Abhydrolase domain-containing 18 n=1 Tax=Panagrolaimus sp. PS1159 TaxID=55785 RepID=A0AC35FNZ6_9BILA
MSKNYVDHIFRRSLLLSKLFTKSWGSPQTLEKLLYFRQNFIGQGKINELIEKKKPTMVITKEWSRKGITYMEGNFISPLYEWCPELFVPGVEICTWRGLFPEKSDKRNGLVIHLAGTGDHTFFRREYGFANDLLKEGYSAILIENPYYGTRKPKQQFSSSLLNVSDLFVMGAAIIGECNFILRWAKETGHWPLGISGVSMGGYMACLAASNVHDPIAVVPCLSWTTAAPVYTEGALSDAIQWKNLGKELSSKHFRDSILQIKDCDWLDQLDDRESFGRQTEDSKRFMWILMEEFTNLSKYPVPYEPSLVKAVIAEEDAYIIRNDVPDLSDLWPGSHIKIIPGVGHVQAYIQMHDVFREVITETMEAARKYSPTETPTKIPENVEIK